MSNGKDLYIWRSTCKHFSVFFVSTMRCYHFLAEIVKLMSDLERFINDDAQCPLDPLIKRARSSESEYE